MVEKLNIKASKRLKQYGDEIHDLGMDLYHLRKDIKYKTDKNTLNIISNYLGKASKLVFDLSDRAKKKIDFVK